VGAVAHYQSPTEAGVTYDPEGAQKLLAEAGHADGQGMSGLSILYNGTGGHEMIAQAIRRNWQLVLHFTVGLESAETTVLNERRRKLDYSITRAGWYGDYRDPTTWLDMFDSRNTGNNTAHWADPKYDGLLDQAAAELDPRQRLSILSKAEELLLREQPMMPIYQYTNLDVFDPQKVHGLSLNAWNFRRLEFVSVERR
jgi:oligopeptide transport system substrate-binding protein